MSGQDKFRLLCQKHGITLDKRSVLGLIWCSSGAHCLELTALEIPMPPLAPHRRKFVLPFVLCIICFPTALPFRLPAADVLSKTDLYGDPLPPGALLRLGSIRCRHHSPSGNGMDTLISPDGQRLATGMADGTCLIWDISAADQKHPHPQVADDQQLQAWWQDLAGTDARRAHQAIWGMIGHPEQSLLLLDERLQPIPPLVGSELEKLMTALGDANFAKREAATRALEQFEELALPTLEKVLTHSNSPEATRRIEQLLNRPAVTQQPEKRRLIRAVEILEQIGAPRALQILKTLSQGAPEAFATQAALDALTRSQLRSPK
jgi:hypothetical protein